MEADETSAEERRGVKPLKVIVLCGWLNRHSQGWVTTFFGVGTGMADILWSPRSTVSVCRRCGTPL